MSANKGEVDTLGHEDETSIKTEDDETIEIESTFEARKYYRNDSEMSLKTESEMDHDYDVQIVYDENEDICNGDDGKMWNPNECGDAEEVKNVYEEVEYLDEDLDSKDLDCNADVVSVESENKQPKTKWPKKLPRALRNKTKKQYTEDEMRMCMEVVRSEIMSKAEACKFYNIPPKTLAFKLAKQKEPDETDEKNERTYLFYKEIKAILTYTNATPYKSSTVKFCCIYCNDGVTIFKDPNELRKHTRTKHMAERIDKVDIFMRPAHTNEILKLDIHNLECVVCDCPIPSWNDLLKHLEEHDVKLDQAYTHVVPYALEQNSYKCMLCKQTFTNYIQLDGHMNSHYDNYICKVCGDHFLSRPRLRTHEKIHATGQYPCEVCHKSFSLAKYRRKHVKFVHEQGPLLKCLYCSEKFQSEWKRQQHVKDKHKDKVKPLICEVCGKVFYWRPYYIIHVNQTHAEKNLECNQCGKKYNRKSRLADHMLTHSESKTFECSVCKKMYKTKALLDGHTKYKHKNLLTLLVVSASDY